MQRKGIDPTEGMPSWLVSTPNGQYQTFVKAADEAGAIEAARKKWGLDDPMSRSRYSDNSFEVQRRQSAPIQARVSAGPAEPAFPGSTQDLQQRRADAAQSQVASGQVVDWKLVYIPADGDPQILHILRGIGPDQGAANRAAREWAANNRSELAGTSIEELAVLPVRVPTGG
jgi:hypothetical protein